MIKQHDIYAVILAGGSGTRFWPLSRRSKPKQFLDVTGKGTFFTQTLKRIKPLAASRNIFINTNKDHRKQVMQALPCPVPSSNILLEPEGKNTGPAVCWAASRIYSRDPDAVLVVLPSDHFISNDPKFLEVIREAIDLAKKDYLVTLGINPTRPETGYGYLKALSVVRNGRRIFKVQKFTEKPALVKAQQFLRSRNYLWNSGMFIFKAAVILDEYKRHLPKVYKFLGDNPPHGLIEKIWKKLPSVSIDYGILEKSNNVVTVPKLSRRSNK